MAAFRQHVTFSSLLGVGYAGSLIYTGFITWPHAVLSGLLCGVSGMLPDLDSDSGKPVREMFALVAAVVPILLIRRIDRFGLGPEETILLLVAVYLGIRFGLSWLFKVFTVHRGMFHSLPAAAIAAEVAYLVYSCPEFNGRLVLAGGVLLGFLSHLVLDEIYAVDISGISVRLNKAAGSAIKLASSSVGATMITYATLGLLSYLVGIEQGYFEPIKLTIQTDTPGLLR